MKPDFGSESYLRLSVNIDKLMTLTTRSTKSYKQINSVDTDNFIGRKSIIHNAGPSKETF